MSTGAVIRTCLSELTGTRIVPADAELLAQYTLRGDPDAFAQLVRRHGPIVLAACRRVLGPTPDAEDAFQTTFLALARHAASVRGPAALPAWLHRTAFRAALSGPAGPRPFRCRPMCRTAPIHWRRSPGETCGWFWMRNWTAFPKSSAPRWSCASSAAWPAMRRPTGSAIRSIP